MGVKNSSVKRKFLRIIFQETSLNNKVITMITVRGLRSHEIEQNGKSSPSMIHKLCIYVGNLGNT